MGRLDGRTAVITGGASGIGAATARAFAAEGARVAVVDRDIAAAETLARELGAAAMANDVTDPADVARAHAAVVDRLGPVEVLVTAAGVSLGGTVEETDPARWDEVFAINVRGTWLWLKAVLPAMRAARRGAIVTVASQLARAGGRGNAAYIASKGAVISLTRTAALEAVEDGVRVNTVLPGATDTPMLGRAWGRAADPTAARERSRTRHPMARFGRPEEIAAGILYLASDEASFVTGIELPVDGGWLAG